MHPRFGIGAGFSAVENKIAECLTLCCHRVLLYIIFALTVDIMGATGSPRGNTAASPASASAALDNQPAISASIPADVVGDDDDADSAIASSIESSTASLSESIFAYRRFNGRTYQSTTTTEYWAPNDEQQNQGLDLTHHALLKLLDNKLYLAPLKDNLDRVLDLGTGTGIWAMDFGDQYPSTEVIGTDISPIQPSWVSPNVKFVIDDFMLPWTWPTDHFDFIHMRYLFGVITSLSELYTKAFNHTKPGGWVQHLEMDVQLQSDHVEYPKEHIFYRWADMTYKAGEKCGRSFAFAKGHEMKDTLESVGFINVSEHKFKAPLHSWPKDPTLKDIGAYLQTAFDESLEGLALFLFTQVMGMEHNEALLFCAEMRKETRRRANYHWFEV
jgi:SAM-dependent methyltransferase